jgi:hypothetical protein
MEAYGAMEGAEEMGEKNMFLDKRLHLTSCFTNSGSFNRGEKSPNAPCQDWKKKHFFELKLYCNIVRHIRWFSA